MLIRATLQQRILLLVLLVIFVTLALVGFATRRIIYDAMEEALGKHALELARLISRLPEVSAGLQASEPSTFLQPLANTLLENTSAGFIVFMDMNAIRYSHPNSTLIGKPFTGGDEGPALEGKEYISRAVGISGPSIRGFVPIYDDQRRQLGVLAVGMFQHNIQATLWEAQNALLRALLLGLLVGIPGAMILARTVRRTMYDMEPEDIATLLEQREAMLNCIREAVIFTDTEDCIALVNDTASKLLNLPPDVLGRPVTDLIPNSRLPLVRQTGQAEYDIQQRINGVVVVANRQPVRVRNKVVGAVETLRDKTEVLKLAEELTGVRRYVDALRAKTHEFMNKLHVIGGLLELEEYDQARELVLQTQKKQQQILQLLTKKIKDPATIGLLLGKARLAEELAIDFRIDPKSSLGNLPEHFPSDAMVLVLGNFIENSFEAIVSTGKLGKGRVEVGIYDKEGKIVIEVQDNGPGIPLELSNTILEKGVSSKGDSHGYGLYLASRQVEELSGGQISITNCTGGGVLARATIPKILPQGGETGV
jgi:sensor histidine kinase regulating citrate/malate metabolism